MSERDNHFELDKPRWVVFDSGWWLTAGGTTLAVLTIVFPSLLQLSLWQRTGISLTLLLLTPLFVTLVIFGSKWGWYVWQRSGKYDGLLSRFQTQSARISDLEGQNEEARNTIRLLVAHIQGDGVFEVAYVQSFMGKVYVRIRKRQDYTLSVGQVVLVLSKADYYPFGTFRVESHEDDYHIGIKDGYVDSVLAGLLEESRGTAIVPPPGTVAVLNIEGMERNG